MKIKLSKTFIIAVIISALAASGLALSFKNSQMVQGDSFYFMKWAGERIDLHLFTFNAQDKQEKHLELAQKRLIEFDELINDVNTEFPPLIKTFKAYRRRLDSAAFMAENLALVDSKFVVQIELVYTETLNHLDRLQDFKNQTAATDLRAVALEYNSRSIKRLLQLHQYDEEDIALYKSLVELMYDFVSGREAQLKEAQLKGLNEARVVLDVGVELEYAHDLLISTF